MVKGLERVVGASKGVSCCDGKERGGREEKEEDDEEVD